MYLSIKKCKQKPYLGKKEFDKDEVISKLFLRAFLTIKNLTET